MNPIGKRSVKSAHFSAAGRRALPYTEAAGVKRSQFARFPQSQNWQTCLLRKKLDPPWRSSLACELSRTSPQPVSHVAAASCPEACRRGKVANGAPGRGRKRAFHSAKREWMINDRLPLPVTLNKMEPKSLGVECRRTEPAKVPQIHSSFPGAGNDQVLLIYYQSALNKWSLFPTAWRTAV